MMQRGGELQERSPWWMRRDGEVGLSRRNTFCIVTGEKVKCVT